MARPVLSKIDSSTDFTCDTDTTILISGTDLDHLTGVEISATSRVHWVKSSWSYLQKSNQLSVTAIPCKRHKDDLLKKGGVPGDVIIVASNNDGSGTLGTNATYTA